MTSPEASQRNALIVAGLLALGLVGLYFLRLELTEVVASTPEEPAIAYRRLYRLASVVLVVFGLVLSVAGAGLLRAAAGAWPAQRLRAILAAAIGIVALVAAVMVPLVALRHVANTLAAAYERNQPQLDWELREPNEQDGEGDNPP